MADSLAANGYVNALEQVREPERIMAVFGGSNASATIVTNLKQIRAVSITPISLSAAPVTDGPFSLGGPPADYGALEVPAGGSLTLYRQGSTANLPVSVVLWGT